MLEKEGRSIFQCGREVTGKEISEIKETVGLFSNLSRTELNATICEHLEWFTASGGYKLDACMKLLEKLEAEDLFRLPVKREEYQRNGPGKDIPLTGRTDSSPDINCKLKELGSVRVKVVNDKKGSGLWNEYVLRYHYLGYKRPFGYFMRYFVVSDQGLLGCILFSGSHADLAWSGIARFSSLDALFTGGRGGGFWVAARDRG